MIVSNWNVWQGCHQILHPMLHLPRCTQDFTHPRRRPLLPPHIYIIHPSCYNISPWWSQGLSRNLRSGANEGGFTDQCTPYLVFLNAQIFLLLRYGWYYHLLALLCIALLATTTLCAGHWRFWNFAVCNTRWEQHRKLHPKLYPTQFI